MGRGKRKQKKRWKTIGLTILMILLFLAIAALIVINLFTVKKVKVTGNEHYSDEAMKDWLLDDEYSWNSLYVYFKYKFVEPREMPFVDSMEVFLKSPQTLEIKVYEKALLGRVYIDALGQNAYFDKDGFVVEMSSEVIEGVPMISGLDVEQIVLYEKLPIKGKDILKNLLSLTQMLKKYEQVPENVRYGGEGNFTLSYGEITVLIGQAQNLNEKVVRLSYIMPKLDGQKGTLHLESWTEHTTDIAFEKTG
ncbi:cell division protein DivIB [Lachnospiraceae bacterium]|nr:cell division protein DivIB [Lachnospiraceae bacterium]